MRVLHTEWSDGWGGQERRVLSELTGMAERGHDTFLVTRPQCRIGAEAQALGLPVSHLSLSGPADYRSVWSLARWLRQRSIHVVNSHSGRDSWVAAMAAKLARTPVLLRTRHLELPLKRSWRNFVHYLPDRIITCGEAMRRRLIEDCGFPPEQLVSIPTGVDFSRFIPQRPRQEVRRALGLSASDFVILMVGIIRGVKRHEMALRAFASLLPKRPRLRLVIAGEGPMRVDTELLASHLSIEPVVRFLGHRTDVADLMGAADMLLLTSRSEGVPQAVTQALGLGLPVVATQVGGVSELIEHRRTGLLVPSEDPDGAAAAILAIMDSPEQATAMGEAGRVHVKKHYGLDAMLYRTEQLCETLLARKSRKHQ